MNTQRIRNLIIVPIICAVLLVTLMGGPTVPSPLVRVIVQGTDGSAAAAAVGQCQGQVLATVEIINAVVAEVPQNRLARLVQIPGVVRVTQDYQVQAAGEVADVEFAKTIGTQEVWQAGDLGAGVTVAVLDSGIDPSFITLHYGPGNNRNSRFLAYYDVFSGKVYKTQQLFRSPGDPNGHGTHVAGIIANSFYEPRDREFRGVAPAANLVAVRVLDETGVGTYSNVLQGINWVVQNKDKYHIRVLNISMYATPVAPYWADPYNLAVMAAWQAGIVVVASAGNGGPAPLSIGVPGNTPYVITVGAFTDNYTPDNFSDDYIPPFSATGPTLDAFVKPDVIAPGAHLVSLMKEDTYLSQQYPENKINGRYFKMSGTSMSAAVVSGIVALMLGEHPELTPDQVKYRLAMTARPQFSEYSGEAAYSLWEQGAGRVWAPDAVFTDLEGAANQGMDLAADLAGTQHYRGWTVYDAATGQFKIQGYDSWAGGYDSWAGGYDSWAGGYDSWAGGYDSWAGGYDSWAGGTTNWSGAFNNWISGYDSWAGGFNAWAGGYDSWAGGYDSWAGGYDSWAGGYDSWAGGYTTWAGGYDSWAGGYDSWAGGVGDPAWAAAFVNLQNVPSGTSTVGINVIADGD